MQCLLRGKGLRNIVCGIETAPSTAEAEDYAKFTHRRDVALTDILLSIEDNCIHAVLNLEDPKAVWDKLKEIYKSVSDACVDAYLAKLQNLRMKDSENVMSYVNRITELENELASVGHTLDENEKRRALLRVVREEFAVTARVIRAMDMKFVKAVSELVVEEGANDMASVKDDSGSTVLAVFQKGKYNCTHCGRKGHTADRCFHNPSSSNYKKVFSYRPPPKTGKNMDSWKSKNQVKGSSDAGEDLAILLGH